MKELIRKLIGSTLLLLLAAILVVAISDLPWFTADRYARIILGTTISIAIPWVIYEIWTC